MKELKEFKALCLLEMQECTRALRQVPFGSDAYNVIQDEVEHWKAMFLEACEAANKDDKIALEKLRIINDSRVSIRKIEAEKAVKLAENKPKAGFTFIKGVGWVLSTVAVPVGTLLLKNVMYNRQFEKALEFETTGVFTSTATKSLIGSVLKPNWLN